MLARTLAQLSSSPTWSTRSGARTASSAGSSRPCRGRKPTTTSGPSPAIPEAAARRRTRRSRRQSSSPRDGSSRPRTFRATFRRGSPTVASLLAGKTRRPSSPAGRRHTWARRRGRRCTGPMPRCSATEAAACSRPCCRSRRRCRKRCGGTRSADCPGSEIPDRPKNNRE